MIQQDAMNLSNRLCYDYSNMASCEWNRGRPFRHLSFFFIPESPTRSHTVLLLSPICHGQEVQDASAAVQLG